MTTNSPQALDKLIQEYEANARIAAKDLDAHLREVAREETAHVTKAPLYFVNTEMKEKSVRYLLEQEPPYEPALPASSGCMAFEGGTGLYMPAILNQELQAPMTSPRFEVQGVLWYVMDSGELVVVPLLDSEEFRVVDPKLVSKSVYSGLLPFFNFRTMVMRLGLIPEFVNVYYLLQVVSHLVETGEGIVTDQKARTKHGKETVGFSYKEIAPGKQGFRILNH